MPLFICFLVFKAYCTAEEDRLLDEEEASSNEDCLDSNLEDVVEEANKENQVKEKQMKKNQKQK